MLNESIDEKERAVAAILKVPTHKINILGGVDVKINIFARDWRDGSPRKKQKGGIIHLLIKQLKDSRAS